MLLKMSLIEELQGAICNGSEPLIQMLRKTKLIAAKLALKDIERWTDFELKGYANANAVPEYRVATICAIQIYNPMRGWGFAGNIQESIKCPQPISEIEDLSKSEWSNLPLPTHANYPVSGGFGSNLPQRLVISGSEFKRIIQAVTDKLLEWTIELEKRGIKGHGMSFNEKEKQSASTIVFNIGTNHGMVGNISESQMNVCDFREIRNALTDKPISRRDMGELEDLMEETKTAMPEQKKSIMGKVEKWIVKHQEALGAAANIIRKAFGGGGEPHHK